MSEVDILRLAEQVGQAASAEAVYLFGSRAAGAAGASGKDSDVDLALILEDRIDPWAAVLAAQRALWPREVSVDLAPISAHTWATSKHSFVDSIRRNGRLLYKKHR